MVSSVRDRPDPIALSRLDRLRTGLLVREAREHARLTQAELATRVGTKQSVVSRWERGHEEPRLGTLARLLRICGFEVDLAFRRLDDVDRSQIVEHLALSPSERLAAVENMAEFVHAVRPLAYAEPVRR